MAASILIADDYDDNRELLRLILEMSGYRIVEARNGREAIEAARDDSFSIALIDLSMPVLDGYGALRELRAQQKTQRLPCIALTAFAGDHDRQRAIGAGFDAYIAKPYHSQDLLQTIERLLQNADSALSNDSNKSVNGSNGTNVTGADAAAIKDSPTLDTVANADAPNTAVSTSNVTD